MLLEPNETPYDLRFRLFGVPVRVHPMFWLLTAVLGWSWMPLGIEYVLAWVACMFISVLVHEFGHIFMGMVFGRRGYIVLYSFGGLAVGSNALGDWWKRVLVSFAGPLAGFVFLAVLMLGLSLAAPGYFYFYLKFIADWFFVPVHFTGMIAIEQRWNRLAEYTVLFLVMINLFLGLINLLPIWPLDGGQISRDLLVRASRDRGLQISLGISFLVAALFAVNALMEDRMGQALISWLPAGGMWMAIMFALLAVQSFMLLQQVSSGAYYDHRDPWGGQGRPWER